MEENRVLELQRETPVYDTVDVLVLGAGPAGWGAAISAAREGAKTLLVEGSSDIGGVATTGLMSHWTGNTTGGIYEEIVERTHHVYGKNPKLNDQEMRKYIDHETMKTRALQMMREAGVKLLLNTMACEPYMEEDRLAGVFVENKSGRSLIRAKVSIDCTGDGDIAARAGAPYFKGRESDGAMQPMTLMVQVGGVDVERMEYVYAFEETYEVPEGDIQKLARACIPAPAGHVLVYPSVFPGVVTLNMTNVTGVDGTNADDLTAAYIQCREQLPEIMEFLQKHVPGFENSFVMKTASQIGVRETRHFIGMRTITEQDILSARVFPDWAVANAHFNFDVHNITGAGLDETGCQKKFSQPKGYTIPYGCLVPQKVDGLLLAGRCISGTHLAHSNYRVMPICANMGQAAGIAAALCVSGGLQPRELPVERLQERLMTLGVKPE